MTKERLEELIKQKATIWYDGHFEIKLNPEQYSITEAFGETVLWYQPKDEPSGYDWSWELDVLREDVDRAKWEYDMFESRTERFEPPMWEDLPEEYEFAFICNQEIFNLTVTRYSVSIIVGHEAVYFSADPTKENYEKACEIVRDLFKEAK